MSVTRLRRQLEDQGYVPVNPTAQDNGTFILYGINTQNTSKSLTIATGVNNGITENTTGKNYNPATVVTPTNGSAITGLASANTAQNYTPLPNELGRVLRIEILNADPTIVTSEAKYILVDGVWLQDSRETTNTVLQRGRELLLTVRVHLTRLITGMKLGLSANFTVRNLAHSRTINRILDITEIYSQLTEEALSRGYVDLYIDLTLDSGDMFTTVNQTQDFGMGLSESVAVFGSISGWIIDQTNPSNVSPTTSVDFAMEGITNITGVIYDTNGDDQINFIRFLRDPTRSGAMSQAYVVRDSNPTKPVAVYSKGFRGTAYAGSDYVDSVGIIKGKHVVKLLGVSVSVADEANTKMGLLTVRPSADNSNLNEAVPMFMVSNGKLIIGDTVILDAIIEAAPALGYSEFTYTFAVDMDTGAVYLAKGSTWRNGGAWDVVQTVNGFDIGTIVPDGYLPYDPSYGGYAPLTYGAIFLNDFMVANMALNYSSNIPWINGFKHM